MEVTRYKNFILGDPILDVLNLKGESNGYTKDCNLEGYDESLLLNNYIGQNKMLFTGKIIDLLGDDFYYVQTSVGKIDILLKTSVLKKYFINGDTVSGNGYSIFTVEYSTIKLNSKGGLSNTGSQKYYNFKNWLLKTQCIKDGYNIDHSFIIGRKYKNNRGIIHDGFNFLIENKETYEELLTSSTEHLSKLHYYTIGEDIFPNMKVKNDFPWHNAKKIIANTINEITLISGYSNQDRDGLVSQGITSYNDIVHPMIQNTHDIINTECNSLPKDENMLFIDFEVLTSVYDDFSNFPKSNDKTYIFNIGLGYIKNSEFSFESYMAKNLSEEFNIISSFVNFINDMQGDTVTFVHWTNIEQRLLVDALKTYNLTITKKIKWLDLHDYFKKSKIYVKGCFNYRLKFVSRQLYDAGLIQSRWTSSFADGLGAMTAYIKFISSIDKDHKILEEIAHYNMIDCRVLWEIYVMLLSLK